MTLAGMQRGTLEMAKEPTRPGEPAVTELAAWPPRASDAAVHERVDLHASVHVPAHDDRARERLCRYLARPASYPFGYREARSPARFGVRRDGLVVYRVKRTGRGRVTQRGMTPRGCLARLAAMVPPPRYPLLRLHGVLAPRHAWRARAVPCPPESHARCTSSSPPNRAYSKAEVTAGAELAAAVVPPPTLPRPSGPRGTGEAALVPTTELVPTRALLETGAASQVAPNILSVPHWARLVGGELYAPMSRLDWATLLRRTFDVDVKHCLACGGRRTVRAVVTAAAAIARLLGALRRSRDPPAAA